MKPYFPLQLKLAIKMLGDDPNCGKQVRSLTRILTLTHTGLVYEADPRHLKLIARSLGLTNCGNCLRPVPKLLSMRKAIMTANSMHLMILLTSKSLMAPKTTTQLLSAQYRCTTMIQVNGICKKILPHMPAPRFPRRALVLGGESPDTSLKRSMAKKKSVYQHLRCDEQPTVREITPYSEIFGVHPRCFVFNGPVGSARMRFITENADPFTGIIMDNYQHSTETRKPPEHARRRRILQRILEDDAAWEDSTGACVDAFLASVSKKPKYLKKRLGRER